MKYGLAICVLAFCAAWAWAGEPEAPSAQLTGYDVALVSLPEPAIEKLPNGETVKHERAYLVRLHGSFPAGGAPNVRLYFGDKPIPEFGGFPGGLYFLLYERPYLDELDGREIRWSYGNGPIRSLGQRFDVLKTAPFKLMPMKEALVRK